MRIEIGTPPTFRALAALVLTLAVLTGCGDSPSEPRPAPMEEIGIVVNSRDRSLTVFPVDDPTAGSTIGVGADGSPVTLAARSHAAVVPLGVVPAATVVDLASGTIARTVALPEGSGATGVAFLNDSIAVVANPNLNSVSPIHVRTGQVGAQIAVGGFGIGLLVWDTQGQTFVRGPADPVAPGGIASVSGVGVDSEGRVYALKPDCQNPSRIYRLTGAYEVEDEIPAGTCPFGIVFTIVPAQDS